MGFILICTQNYEEKKADTLALWPDCYTCSVSLHSFAWISEANTIPGLDAMVYLLFLRLLKYLFSAMSVLAGLLAITNYYLNTQTTYGSMSTISPSGSEDDMTKRDSPSSSSSETSSNNTSIIDNPQLLTAANVTSNGLLVHISFEWIATMTIIVFG